MKQQTLAMAADNNAQYEQFRRPTRRDTFLATMEQIVPWSALCAVIEPHYTKAGNGQPPVGLERMLREDRNFASSEEFVGARLGQEACLARSAL